MTPQEMAHVTSVMKTCTTCLEAKPSSCFHWLSKKNGTLRTSCKDCTLAANAAYRQANRDSVLAQKRQYAKEHQATEKVRRDAWRALYGEREKLQQRQYREKNRESLAQYIKEYAKKNPGKMHAITMRRRIGKVRQTPSWADNRKIQEIYDFANEFREAGFDVHVDHIVPISGQLVRGFHVENNLRVCLAKHNLRKSNNFTVEV